jgi:hypothetical protein
MALSVKQQALTRPKFDDFHQVDDMRITSYALRYYLNPPDANCPVSFPVDATTRIQKSGASWPDAQWRTDVETDLKGVNRFSSRVRCNEALYNPDTNKLNQVPLRSAPDESFPQLFQRINNPPCTLRATGWNRWVPLPHQPQQTFETPFDHFIPSRMLDKEKCRTHGYPAGSGGPTY